MGSIPIARSINPVDAVGFTGFPPPKFPYKKPSFGRSWTRIPAASGHLGRDDSGICHFSDYGCQALSRIGHGKAETDLVPTTVQLRTGTILVAPLELFRGQVANHDTDERIGCQAANTSGGSPP